MAKVPVRAISTVEQQGLPDTASRVRAGAGSFGGVQAQELEQFGAATQRVGSALFAEGEKRQIEYNRTRALDISNKIEQDSLAYISQMKQKRGKAGTNVVEETKKRLDEMRQKYMADAENPAQKALLGNVIAGNEQDLLRNSYAWQDRQREVDKFEVTTAALQTKIDASVGAVGTDDFPIVNAKGILETKVGVRSLYRGHDPEFIKQKEKEALRHYHTEIINTMEVNDPYGALEYINKYKEFFQPKDVAARKRIYKIDIEVNKQESSGKPFNQQVSDALSNKDISFGSDVASKLIQRYQQKKMARDLDEQTIMGNLNQAFLSNKNLTVTDAFAAIDKANLSPGKAAAMKANWKTNIESVAMPAAKAKFEATGNALYSRYVSAILRNPYGVSHDQILADTPLMKSGRGAQLLEKLTAAREGRQERWAQVVKDATDFFEKRRGVPHIKTGASQADFDEHQKLEEAHDAELAQFLDELPRLLGGEDLRTLTPAKIRTLTNQALYTLIENTSVFKGDVTTLSQAVANWEETYKYRLSPTAQKDLQLPDNYVGVPGKPGEYRVDGKKDAQELLAAYNVLNSIPAGQRNNIVGATINAFARKQDRRPVPIFENKKYEKGGVITVDRTFGPEITFRTGKDPFGRPSADPAALAQFIVDGSAIVSGYEGIGPEGIEGELQGEAFSGPASPRYRPGYGSTLQAKEAQRVKASYVEVRTPYGNYFVTGNGLARELKALNVGAE